WWNRTSAVSREALPHHMTGGAAAAVVGATLKKLFHRVGIVKNNARVVSLGTRRLGKPPNIIHRILRANPLDGHPRRRRWKTRRVVPVKVLRQVKPISRPPAKIDE